MTNLIKHSTQLKVVSAARVEHSVVQDKGYFDAVKVTGGNTASPGGYITMIYNVLSRQPAIGEKATLSLMVRGERGDGKSDELRIYYNSGTSTQTITGITNEYQWLSVTFDVNSESSRFHFYPDNWEELYIAKAQLEIGDKSTRHKLNPEDTPEPPAVKDVNAGTNLYFFDGSLNLQKIVTSKNINAALHEQELNGLIICNIEMDMAYTKQFIHNVDYVGYYVKGVYHLHHIKRVEDNHEDESVLISGRHIFFEDMLYGEYIRDVRPQNQEAAYVLRQTIEMNTRWNIVMTDTTKRLSGNHYWQSPMEVLNDIVESYGIEYEPRILFDGQKINGYQLHVANKIGEDKNIRIPFGHRVLNLKYEIDYSEIVTALYGHGKGEEVGDGYGRRINLENVNFSRNGVVSPVGRLYMEDPNITAIYGKDDGSPKFGRVVFEDIESPNDLAEATYEAYLEQSKPKMLFEASVADIGDVAMGDSLLIIRRDRDVYFEARIHKIAVDLLYQEDMDVELGDYQHFKESKVARKTRENNNQWQRQVTSRIQQLKDQFNTDFDDWVRQFKEEFDQALIDALAEVEARRERMETEWQQQWNDGMQAYERDKQAAYDEAERNYIRIETEVNDAIDRNRDEVEIVIRDGIAESEQKAQNEIERKTQEVQSNLDTVTSSHRGMIDDLQVNVLDINDFIGPKDRSLTELLYNQRTELEEKIETYSRNHPNLVVGSTLENIDGFEPFQTTEFELRTNESLNYIRVHDDPGRNTLAYYFPDTVFLEQGNWYTLGIDFRSDAVEDLDYIYFMGPYNNVALQPIAQTRGLEADGNWHRYYFTFYWSNTTRQTRLMIGTLLTQGSTQRGWFDTRQVHLYEGETHNIPWTPSPSDNAQIITQFLYEIRRLDDGMQSLATKTELDMLTGDFNQFTNEFTSTAERMESTLQQHDNWLTANGSTLEQTADMVQSKVWMNDISEINGNMIPFADTRDEENLSQWTFWNANANAVSSRGYFVVRNTSASTSIGYRSSSFEVVEGQTYTLSFKAFINNNINGNFNYCYLWNEGSGGNQFIPSADGTRRYISAAEGYLFTRTFTANFTGRASVLIGSRVNDAAVGTDVRIEYTEPKLEIGSQYTPFMNAFSVVEQMANQIRMAVQGIDGRGFLTQSDIQIRSDYVQLGSQRLGDNQLASILRVSPNSIDAITDNLNLTGNLNVKGQIESLSLSVVEGNFARLFTSRLNANVIETRHISGLTAWFESMYVMNANIERLVAQHVFTNAVTAQSIQAIEGEFGRLFVAQLNANVINTDHISGLTAEFQRMYILNANIERLVAQHVFTREVRTLSIEAVEADIGHVRSLVLESNVILSSHVNASNAIIDKLFSENAYISRLTTKAQFVRDIQAIEITANQLNLNVLQNKLGSAEGGLYIYGPDGRVLINNSILRASFDVQIRPSYAHSDVSFTGLNYSTQSADWRQFEYFYTDWKGSQLLVSWATSLQSGGSASEYCKIRVRGFGGTNPIGTRESRRFVTPGNTDFWNQTISLGVPNYATIQAYLEFCRDDSTGGSTSNRVLARVLRVSLIN